MSEAETTETAETTEEPVETEVKDSPETTEEPVETPTEEKADEPEVTEEAEKVPAEKPADEPFPNKAKNAISRRNRKIAKLQAQLREQSATKDDQPKEPKAAPKEDDFETYGDFMKAQNTHDLDARFDERDKQQQETRETREQDQWIADRTTVQTENAQKLIENTDKYPDYNQVLNENLDVLEDFSEDLHKVFLEAENGPLAFYTLCKEGAIDSLLDMTPYQAAMAIGGAIARTGIATAATSKPATKKVSGAPIPITGLAGTSDNTNNPADMNPDELIKWVNK